ncbi:MAG: hypothetical protein MUO26_00365 [Methanotrichaceae archaeon]|nr:hypothetical protein [Methanotrichaceae archaeon]
MTDKIKTYNGVVDASEILAKIKNAEPVEYDNVIIKGDLDINGLNLSQENGRPVINSQISITNSRFDGYIKFHGVIFKKDINFRGTLFSRYLYQL